MSLFRAITTFLFMLILVGCGGGKSSNANSIANEKITFEEKQNGNLEIIWDKAVAAYKVLAVEKRNSSKLLSKGDSSNKIKLYESTSAGKIIIICRPDQLRSTVVTYQCTVKQNNKVLSPFAFVLYSSEGRYSFAIGSGTSFEKARFSTIADEKISTSGLDINIKYGEYKLLDKHRTPAEYHGYFLLLEKDIAKGREFVNGDQEIPDYELVWKYNRDKKEIILDNSAVGGGYSEGNVFGNSKKFHMLGHWNDGRNLDATLEFMSDSRSFTLSSKKVPTDDQSTYQSTGSHY